MRKEKKQAPVTLIIVERKEGTGEGETAFKGSSCSGKTLTLRKARTKTPTKL